MQLLNHFKRLESQLTRRTPNLMHNQSKDLFGPYSFYRNNVLLDGADKVVKRHTLAAVNTHVGNHKDPTVHSYYSQKLDWPTGRRETWQSGFTVHDVENGRISDYGVPTSSSGSPSSASVYNKALKKLYDQIRDSDLNLTVDIAEFRQAQRMLSRTSQVFPKLFRMARAARSKGLSKFGRSKPGHGYTIEDAKNSIGNAWLEYRYGWRPLLSSIWDLANFEQHVTSRRRIKARASTTNVWSTQIPALSLTVPGNYLTIHSLRWEIGITYRVRQPALFNATRILSLNPLAIAWELLPYSFVVDWFIDIGGYMQMWEQSFFLGLEFEKGYQTVSERKITKGRYSGTRGSPTGSFYQIVEAPFRMVESSMGRTPISAPPRPYLPRFQPKLGWQRILSGAALLNQILSPDPKSFR